MWNFKMPLPPPVESEPKFFVLMKGKGDPRKFGVEDPMDALSKFIQHLDEYGFSGWRICGGVVLNMSEVQAAWVQDAP